MLTYWFKGLPHPNKSKGFEIDIFGYDVDKWNRIFGAWKREEQVSKRLIRRLAAEAVINVILRS